MLPTFFCSFTLASTNLNRLIFNNSNMEQVKNDTAEAKRIVDDIRSSSSLGAVTGIQQINETVSRHLTTGQEQLFKTAKLLDDAQKSFEDISIKIEKVNQLDKTVDYELNHKVLDTFSHSNEEQLQRVESLLKD